jgi:hypothetical protein
MLSKRILRGWSTQDIQGEHQTRKIDSTFLLAVAPRQHSADFFDSIGQSRLSASLPMSDDFMGADDAGERIADAGERIAIDDRQRLNAER